MLQGSLENFALDEVLGLLSGTSKTGQLEIAGNRGTGTLVFHDGRSGRRVGQLHRQRHRARGRDVRAAALRRRHLHLQPCATSCPVRSSRTSRPCWPTPRLDCRTGARIEERRPQPQPPGRPGARTAQRRGHRQPRRVGHPDDHRQRLPGLPRLRSALARRGRGQPPDQGPGRADAGQRDRARRLLPSGPGPATPAEPAGAVQPRPPVLLRAPDRRDRRRQRLDPGPGLPSRPRSVGLGRDRQPRGPGQQLEALPARPSARSIAERPADAAVPTADDLPADGAVVPPGPPSPSEIAGFGESIEDASELLETVEDEQGWHPGPLPPRGED